PEILSLGTLRGEPVVVRAANPVALFSLEGGTWVQPPSDGDRPAYAGEGLLRRVGLTVGDNLTVVGSAVPRIAFVRIAGIFRTAVAEATSSVSVVAYGIAVLLGILVAFGIHAVQARAFADRAPAIGVLRAIGAGNHWMRRRLLAELLPLSVGAAILGAGLGFLAEKWLQPNASLVIFR